MFRPEDYLDRAILAETRAQRAPTLELREEYRTIAKGWRSLALMIRATQDAQGCARLRAPHYLATRLPLPEE